MVHAWVEHIRQYAKEHNLTYPNAMKEPGCKASYKGKKSVVGRGPKVEPKKENFLSRMSKKAFDAAASVGNAILESSGPNQEQEEELKQEEEAKQRTKKAMEDQQKKGNKREGIIKKQDLEDGDILNFIEWMEKFHASKIKGLKDWNYSDNAYTKFKEYRLIADKILHEIQEAEKDRRNIEMIERGRKRGFKDKKGRFLIDSDDDIFENDDESSRSGGAKAEGKGLKKKHTVVGVSNNRTMEGLGFLNCCSKDSTRVSPMTVL